MKKIIGVLIFMAGFSLTNSAFAQDENNSLRDSPLYRLQVAVYNRAVKYNDQSQAMNALYHLCVMESQNDSILYNLAYMYFDRQEYISAILTINDVMLLNSNNLNAQEVKAISLDRIGAKDKALEEYESLYLKDNNNVNYLYKAAFAQYELKRYKECITNIEIMLEGGKIDEEKFVFPTADNQQQEIPMKASLLNLRGLVELDQGNKEEARKYYNEALALSPDFYICQENLKKLDE